MCTTYTKLNVLSYQTLLLIIIYYIISSIVAFCIDKVFMLVSVIIPGVQNPIMSSFVVT